MKTKKVELTVNMAYGNWRGRWERCGILARCILEILFLGKSQLHLLATVPVEDQE